MNYEVKALICIKSKSTFFCFSSWLHLTFWEPTVTHCWQLITLSAVKPQFNHLTVIVWVTFGSPLVSTGCQSSIVSHQFVPPMTANPTAVKTIRRSKGPAEGCVWAIFVCIHMCVTMEDVRGETVKTHDIVYRWVFVCFHYWCSDMHQYSAKVAPQPWWEGFINSKWFDFPLSISQRTLDANFHCVCRCVCVRVRAARGCGGCTNGVFISVLTHGQILEKADMLTSQPKLLWRPCGHYRNPPSLWEAQAAAPSCCLPAARDWLTDVHTPIAEASALHFPTLLFIQSQSVTLFRQRWCGKFPLHIYSAILLHCLNQDNLATSTPLSHKFPIHGDIFTSTSTLQPFCSINMTESSLKRAVLHRFESSFSFDIQGSDALTDHLRLAHNFPSVTSHGEASNDSAGGAIDVLREVADGSRFILFST